MGIQDSMTDAEKLEYRNAHPLCTFCENSYIKCFKIWCTKYDIRVMPKAKMCPHYNPTLVEIEKRSPSV